MSKELSEIAKLTERIAKDPKSKLFVPLAEEYKKTGDIEMSIYVLTEGLKNNPGYITARSFLGRLLIEKGDLPAAQKEFEEVVKAIPDNLMAQRKLGDLYALQDRPADALQHYKVVLSLNPKDQETATLIAEAEAGRDIKSYLPKPKLLVIQEEPKIEAPAKAAVTAAPPKPAAKPQPAAAVKKSQPAPAILKEEPEEVLMVEPLEPAAPATVPNQLAAENMEFLAESAAPQPAGEAETEPGDHAFTLDDPVHTEQELIQREALEPEEDPFAISAIETSEPEKQADDFTTDTLAELYITQGFFEKAVDIYERMLVDKPNSQGLKDKLTKVRAMAAAAGPAESPEQEEIVDAEIIPDTETDLVEASEPEQDKHESFVTPAPASQPRLDDFELPATQAAPARASAQPIRKTPEPKHFDVGFEPREYVPPDAVPRQATRPVSEPAPVQNPEREPAEPPPARRKSAATRKETVDRLEHWLKNIIKES